MKASYPCGIIIHFLCLPGETFAVLIFPVAHVDYLASLKIQQLLGMRMKHFSKQEMGKKSLFGEHSRQSSMKE